MKKIIILSAVLLLTGIYAVSAQGFYYGPKAGLNLSTLTKTSYSKSRLRANVGVFGGYQINDIIALQGELLYSWQGTSLTNPDAKYSFNYFKIPLLVKFFVTGGFNVEAGLSPDFKTTAKLKIGGETSTIKGETKGFDLSIPIGINYQFANNIDVGLRYYVSMARVWEDSRNKAKNSNLSLTVGYRF